MANALAGNVWVLDTANTTTVVDDRRVWIKSIRWDDATTANHKAVLKDGKGNIFYQSTASGDNNEDVQMIEGWVSGFIMHTLDSGTILLQLG